MESEAFCTGQSLTFLSRPDMTPLHVPAAVIMSELLFVMDRLQAGLCSTHTTVRKTLWEKQGYLWIQPLQ